MTYREWFDFASSQRIHGNLLEVVVQVCVLILVSGISYPKVAVYAGSGFILSRICQLFGPNKFAGQISSQSLFKVVGFWGGNIAQIALLYHSFKTCIYLGNVEGVLEAKEISGAKIDL